MGERHATRGTTDPAASPPGDDLGSGAGGDPPRDPARTFAAVVLAAASGLYIYLGGLSVPYYVVGAGLLVWAVAVGAMWRRLRAGDDKALAVPLVLVVGWQLFVWAGMLVVGWSP